MPGFARIATEHIARAGSGGPMARLFSHTIGVPPIVARGSEALKRRVVRATPLMTICRARTPVAFMAACS